MVAYLMAVVSSVAVQLADGFGPGRMDRGQSVGEASGRALQRPPARPHPGPCSGPRQRCGHPCYPRPGPTPSPASPDRISGCTDHRNENPDPFPPIGASWPASPVLATRPIRHLPQSQDIHPGIFGHYSSSLTESRCRPSPCARAFPGPEYYGGSAPSWPDRPPADPARISTMDYAARGKTGAVPVFTN